MKKISCVILTFILLMSLSYAYATDSDLIEFEPDLASTFTDTMDSPQDWSNSGGHRALLALLLLCDVQDVYENVTDVYIKALQDADVYVGRMGKGELSSYIVTYRTSEHVLQIGFFPLSGTAYYGELGWVSKSTIKEVMDYDRFWELETEDIKLAVGALSSIVD